jgi:predicted Zn-dependent peptidase
VDVVFKIPPASSPDVDALRVASSVLGSGRSSRLYENIVRQKQLAVQIATFVDDRRGPGLFTIDAMVAPGRGPADVEAAIDEQISNTATGAIADWEMDKARNGERRALAGRVQSSLQRAILLTEYAVAFNDPGRINTQARRIAAVTAADVQRVIKKYLVPGNRSVIVTTPAPETPSKGDL